MRYLWKNDLKAIHMQEAMHTNLIFILPINAGLEEAPNN
jgi:hypothetical protein